jgi:hypothetical protein
MSAEPFESYAAEQRIIHRVEDAEEQFEKYYV